MPLKTGTKKDVWNAPDDQPMKTSGGLLKKDLCLSKRNKVVSRKRSEASKKNSERLRQFQFKKKDMNTPSEK